MRRVEIIQNSYLADKIPRLGDLTWLLKLCQWIARYREPGPW